MDEVHGKDYALCWMPFGYNGELLCSFYSKPTTKEINEEMLADIKKHPWRKKEEYALTKTIKRPSLPGDTELLFRDED